MSGLRPRHFLFRGMMQGLSSLRSDILGWGVKENKMSGLRPRHFLFRGMIKGLSSLRSDHPPKKRINIFIFQWVRGLSSLRSDIPPEAEGVKENKMSGLRPRHFLFRGMMQGLSSLRSDILGWGVKENKMSGLRPRHFLFRVLRNASIPRSLIKNVRQRRTFYFPCGERGIRTPGPLTVNGFQDRRIRPLCHLSGCKIIALRSNCKIKSDKR